MGKNSFRRGIFKNTSAITGVQDVIGRIKANLKDETKEFKHIIYEEFTTIKRMSAEELKEREEKLKGIMKYHHIYIDSSGTLQGKRLSCLQCTISTRCKTCE